MRLAAIDIGSNSVRSTIVDVAPDRSRTTLDEEKAYTRLGRGTVSTGLLADEAMDETVDALERMLRIADGRGVTHTRAIATAAVRGAGNGPAFIERIRSELGLEVEVISGEHEGALALMSAADSFDMSGSAAVLDVGGGSVEVVLAESGAMVRAISVPLGAVVMSERFGPADPLSAKRFARLVTHIETTLDEALGGEVGPVGMLVGSGGTVTTIGWLAAARRGLELPGIHGFRVTAAEVSNLTRDLSLSTTKERAAMRGMPTSRVDLMVAGSAVVDAVLRALGAAELVVNARGMREGIVIEAVARERGSVGSFDRMRAVREASRGFAPGADHAEQVRRLSCELFDALAGPLALPADDRPLLEAAALLHDIGYAVSHDQHNKHSHHIIIHTDLPGFDPQERRIIAAIARYHRGSLPRPKHPEIAGMSPAERNTVSRLAALLRVADGLDRSGAQRVRALALEVTSDEVVARIAGDSALDAEVYGARKKADLFEEAFARRMRIVVE